MIDDPDDFQEGVSDHELHDVFMGELEDPAIQRLLPDNDLRDDDILETTRIRLEDIFKGLYSDHLTRSEMSVKKTSRDLGER